MPLLRTQREHFTALLLTARGARERDAATLAWAEVDSVLFGPACIYNVIEEEGHNLSEIRIL